VTTWCCHFSYEQIPWDLPTTRVYHRDRPGRKPASGCGLPNFGGRRGRQPYSSASKRFALASASVSPCEIAAGISSTKQVYPPSFAGSKTAVSFISIDYHSAVSLQTRLLGVRPRGSAQTVVPEPRGGSDGVNHRHREEFSRLI
jgi:hypothetical protein